MTGHDLIELRKRLHWSQTEAAKQLGCSARSIVAWEKGERKIPRSVALAASAAMMNLPPYGEAR